MSETTKAELGFRAAALNRAALYRRVLQTLASIRELTDRNVVDELTRQAMSEIGDLVALELEDELPAHRAR